MKARLTPAPVSGARRKLTLTLNHAGGDQERASFTITRLDVLSVARVAIVFWSCVAAAVIALGAVVWALLALTGAIAKFERFVTHATGVDTFHLVTNGVLGTAALVIFVGTVFVVLCAVLAAVWYNALAMMIGGVTVEGCETGAFYRPAADR
jgi:hypothetical protein